MLIGILCVCLFVTVARAADGAYRLIKVGQYAQGNDFKVKGPRVTLYNETPNSDGELAISIQKKGIFSYSLVSRDSVWMQNKKSYILDFDNAKNTYRPTIVFNASKDGNPEIGTYDIDNVPQ